MKKRNVQRAGSSARQREQARLAISRWNVEIRPFVKRCGARRKSDGQPCRHIAMENGRCYVHGGRTPKGDGWHKPRWPKPSSSNGIEKIDRKIQILEDRRKAREKRIAQMTDDERARYEKQKRTHKPGSMKRRQADKRNRQDSQWLQSLLAEKPGDSIFD